jgi:uncharacterized membrane protein
MTPQWMLLASEFSVIAYALVAGVFLTFSDFVMRSLAATQPAGGIEAMQQINRKVFRTLFMVLLIGMAVVSPLMAACRPLAGERGGNRLDRLGSRHLCDRHVRRDRGVQCAHERTPRPDEHDSTVAAAYWHRYVPAWSFWNTVRTLASAAAAILMLMAVVELA